MKVYVQFRAKKSEADKYKVILFASLFVPKSLISIFLVFKLNLG